MERSEPALVPEWLRSSGSVTGGGSSAQHFALSSLHSDVPSLANHTRNRSSKSTGDYDSPRAALLERTASSNSRRSSGSNGFTKHPYSSFTRSHRDKDRDKERDRSSFLDHWDSDCSETMASILGSKVEKDDMLRRSHSMISRKQSEMLPRRVATDSKTSNHSNHINGNGVALGGSVVSSIQKAAFEKDFPSLGVEERQGATDVGRVPSPGLCTAVQNLPIGNSALIGGEGWTSVLAEVPPIIGSNSIGPSSVQQTVAVSPVSASPSTTSGLNMAEALTQNPSRARTAPQLSVQTQRLEELALKQSRQLIPMTPSMSKGSVLNSSDKPKSKTVVRTSETLVATGKSGQQQLSSSHLPSQSLRSASVRSDTPKTSHGGKFLVLKPVWENGVSYNTKDVSSPTNNSSGRVANSQVAVSPTASSSLKSSNNSKGGTVDRKLPALALNSGSNVERRPSSSQAQSRNDFFNLVRKKSSMNTSRVLADPGSAVLPPIVEKSAGEIKDVASAPVSPHATENIAEVISNGDTCENTRRFSDSGESNLSPNAADLEEEETRFLRSLGWEENAEDDEGLTEEEINEFFQEYMKLRPSSKLSRGLQPKLSMLPESHAISGEPASELSLSDSESKA